MRDALLRLNPEIKVIDILLHTHHSAWNPLGFPKGAAVKRIRRLFTCLALLFTMVSCCAAADAEVLAKLQSVYCNTSARALCITVHPRENAARQAVRLARCPKRLRFSHRGKRADAIACCFGESPSLPRQPVSNPEVERIDLRKVEAFKVNPWERALTPVVVVPSP